MFKLPKLKVKLPYGDPSEVICEVEEAKYRFNNVTEGFLVIEGRIVTSYEQLVQLASQAEYKHSEFLEGEIIRFVAGG